MSDALVGAHGDAAGHRRLALDVEQPHLVQQRVPDGSDGSVPGRCRQGEPSPAVRPEEQAGVVVLAQGAPAEQG
ncbi:hypothetical protein [Streptomyces sp. NRRL F-4474]|uniref:hypothetical protein n=1 Tax=Streptomyces sp. NRRL F-4474 TaxID=1463851 RepID=UPI0004C65FC1|nr:hypothetical protein [Streptomyces sp. NRRL F-4474]